MGCFILLSLLECMLFYKCDCTMKYKQVLNIALFEKVIVL